MSAAAAPSVAQFSQGDIAEKGAGTGTHHSNPNTDSTIGGTQIQCSVLLVGSWWLAPYSLSRSFTVRMPGKLTPGARGAQAAPRAQAAIRPRSFPRALASIWRMRSADTPYFS